MRVVGDTGPRGFTTFSEGEKTMAPARSVAESGKAPLVITCTWLVATCAWTAVFTNGVVAAAPDFNPKVVVRRSFPPITNPTLRTAAHAANQIGDAELVLGVEIDGKSRAYPINMLTGPSREIINDSIAGHAIAATW